MEKNEAVAQQPPLTDAESRALRVWQLDPKAPTIAEETGLKMMSLFLRGYGCEAIAKEFPGFPLGAIVAIRLRQNWDEGRVTYLEKLRASVIDQTALVGAETTRTAIDLLHCANIDIGFRARAHLAGKGPAPLKVESVSQYKSLIELVLRVLEPAAGQRSSGVSNAAPPPELPPKPELSMDEELALLAKESRAVRKGGPNG